MCDAGQRDDVREDLGDVVEVKAVIVKLRRLERAVVLVDQVVQLTGQQARQLDAHRLDIAGVQRHLLFARQAQQRAVLHDLELFGILGDAQGVVGLLKQDVAAKATQAFGYLDVDHAPDVGLKAEAVGGGKLALVGDLLQLQRRRGLEDFIADLVGAPAVLLFLRRRFLQRSHRQYVGADGLFHLGFGDAGVGL